MAGKENEGEEEDTPLDAQDRANIEKIKSLLKPKNDDTQKFAGLALLKSVLNNSPRLRADPKLVHDHLWTSMDGKFVTRLIKTGSKPQLSAKDKDKESMLQLGVSVLHIFAVLLPESALAEAKFTDRISVLVPALLHSKGETIETLLQLLLTLASTEEGAKAILQVEDLSPLTETASTNPIQMIRIRLSETEWTM
jgi:Neurochondrin